MAIGTAASISGSFLRNLLLGKGTQLWTLRAAAVLTTSFVDTSHIPCDGAKSVGFFITCAAVDYTSIEVVYEVSYDGSLWFAIPAREPVAAGIAVAGPFTDSFVLASFRSATATKIAVGVSVPFGVRFARASLKRTGGSATGTVLVEAIEGVGV
jgi:hypothetical protein